MEDSENRVKKELDILLEMIKIKKTEQEIQKQKRIVDKFLKEYLKKF